MIKHERTTKSVQNSVRRGHRVRTDLLRLFGPGVLEVIPPDKAWNKTLIFRSAPGGGKTSLFRLFTPPSLLSLHYRSNEEYKELFGYLKSLDAISDDRPLVLGIMLSCARNYADLEDLAFDKIQKTRLFFSLLNSRITLAMLRNALTFSEARLPQRSLPHRDSTTPRY